MQSVEALVRVALERGYVTPEQVAEARSLATASGRPGDLLQILGTRYLSPAQVNELRASWSSASASALDRGAGTASIAPTPPAVDRGAGTVSLAPAPAPGVPTSTPSARIRRGATPDRMGPYVIERELARGGMGAVYIARHEELGRRVALKVMLGSSPRHRTRFLTEAQATAKLRHPNVVAIHEAGEERGAPYLAMDLIDGEPLDEVIEREEQLDPRQAAELTAKIARGIQAAHDQGILHRDMKPANVLIDSEGEPRITDFGLAKDVEGAESLTKTGQVLGTPAYMPPEQATGDRPRIGPQSDVYSIGATFYEMLTGERLFDGDAMNLLVAVVTAAPLAPRKHRPDLDRGLEAICLKCLEKDPANRYASAQALADDLQRWLDGEAIEARRRLPVGLVVAPVLLLLLLGGGLVAWKAGGDPATTVDAPPEETSTDGSEAPDEKGLTVAETAAGSQEIASLEALPDASVPAAVERWLETYPGHPRADEVRSLRAEAFKTVPARRFEHAGCREAVFLLDGERVLTQAIDEEGKRGTVFLWDLAKTEPVRRWRRKVFRLALLPDGSGFLFTWKDAIYRATWKGKPKRVFRCDPEHVALVRLAFSPSGSLLAVGTNTRKVLIVDVAAWKVQQTVEGHQSDLRQIIFVGESTLVTACGGVLEQENVTGEQDNAVRVWDLEAPGDEPRRIQCFAAPYGLAPSPTHRRYAVGCDRRIMIYNVDSVEPRMTYRGTHLLNEIVGGAHRDVIRDVVYSADGRRLISVGGSHKVEGSNEVRLWDTESGEQLWRRGDLGERPSTADLSPDGTRVLVSDLKGACLWDLSALR